MRVHRFHERTRLPAARDEVFPFFADATNLQRITPPELGFRILTPGVEMREGARVNYSLSLFGIRFAWLTEITRWDPPHEFVDVQLRGPYRQWIHTHRFVKSDGVVVMDDHVDYALPFGPLGRLVHRLRVRRQLEEIFEFRRRAIDGIFPSPRSTLDPRLSTFSP